MKKLNDYDYEVLINLLERYCEQLQQEYRISTARLVLDLICIASTDKFNL